MNQIEIGKFIAECRKGKKLTQAQLAEKLNITDRAVSKWETGKSMPDSSIMLELCEILGITVNELLSGRKIDNESYEEKADNNLITLKRKAENGTTKNRIISLLFSATLLLAIMVCLICNIALSGSLTWSLIPVSSIVFGWAVLFPCMIAARRGVLASFLSFSVFVVPYLFLLSRLTNVKAVFTIGTVMAIPVILFLWSIVFVFSRVGKVRSFVAWGITFLLSVLLVLSINIILSKLIQTPVLDIWDILSIFILSLSAMISFVYSYVKKPK